VAALRVDEHLRGAAEYLFQGFDVDALAGDPRRLLVLDEDLREPVGLAFGVGDDACPIGLGILPAPRRLAARPRQHVIRIPAGLENPPRAVLTRPDRVLHAALYGAREVGV